MRSSTGTVLKEVINKTGKKKNKRKKEQKEEK